MSNEEIAKAIKEGNKALKPQLWDNVQRLLYMKARDCYTKYYNRCINCGIELTDLYQECYTAFEYALRAYDPSSKYKFTSYLKFPLKYVFRQVLGYSKNNELNTSISLEQPINSVENEVILLLDVLQDEKALEFVYLIDNLSETEQIKKIIEELPDRPKRVIIAYYFKGQTLQAIAQEMHISCSYVQQIRKQAERVLKRSTQLQSIYNKFYKQHPSRPRSTDWNPERYYLKEYNKPPESYAREQEKQYKLYNKWKDEIIIEYYL